VSPPKHFNKNNYNVRPSYAVSASYTKVPVTAGTLFFIIYNRRRNKYGKEK